ncbi:XRE family transcriptional regulator [Paenibacillus nanensis]|uniref:XRE family transcriptional regulator n=1 Tax=Paenibacillus nanensis TaxID=393251 RepID=A0A3A1UNA5_9BACL|nr:helix-turn-helix transcriptional regulator [Paenibacillus nanensis]RIX50047.1 XRE family transcriptional regulator [Paenibacillus nanensis]
MNILEDFGMRLKELRLRSNLSQDMLAARCGLDRTYIGSVERGERNISLKNIQIICNTLDIDISYFFCDERFSLRSASLKSELDRPLTERFRYYESAEENLIMWQVSGALSLEEIKSISVDLKAACLKLRLGKVKLLVDNRKMMASGEPIVFQHEITERWEELQRWFLPHCEQIIVLCNSKLMQNQMNRLAKRSGIIEVQRCLYCDDEDWLTKELRPESYFNIR